MPNKWHSRSGEDWRPKFPERIPLLGQYNCEETMNREIVAAAEHGVDFFAILWYYNPPGVEKEPNSRYLERGITDFMNSPQAHRLRFMIDFCNSPRYEVTRDEDWERCISVWLKCMAHPSYLRIGGKAVFKVHGGHNFLVQSGKNLDVCRQRLDRLREAARQAGVGEMMIGCGVGGHEPIPEGHWAMKLFDFTSTYMDVPPLDQRPDDYPYATLAAFTEEGRKKHAQDTIPYLPHVAAGWNPRPWPDRRAYFTFPTRQEWGQVLKRMREDLQTTGPFGFPGQKAFTIYAWNEFGEGGIVAPTQGEETMKLDVLHGVFGSSRANQIPDR